MQTKLFTKTFRLSKEEVEYLKDGAQRHGMTESQWFRYLLKVGIGIGVPKVKN